MSPSLISGSGEDGCLDSGAGVEEWGAYGMLQSCWRCQYLQGIWAVPTDGTPLPTGTTGTAYWVPLLQRPQSIVGPSESAIRWIIYVSAPTCQRLYDTLFLQCTVRRFRGETNISAERKCCTSVLFAAFMNCSFVYITSRAASCLPPSQAQSDWCFHSLIEMQETYRQKIINK